LKITRNKEYFLLAAALDWTGLEEAVCVVVVVVMVMVVVVLDSV